MMKRIGIFLLSSVLAGCTTTPYANVATTYAKTIELLETSGKESLGRIRGRVRTAYVEAYEWDIAHGGATPRPKFSTLLCQPQRAYSRAVANLALQARAASGLSQIAQPTPKELAPAIGTLGATYSSKLPPIPGTNEDMAKEVFEACLEDSNSKNPAGEFIDDQRINESAGGIATGLTEVISILSPSIVSFIGFIDQRRRAEAIRVYFAPCPTNEVSGSCGGAAKLKAALTNYAETVALLNRYERRRAAVTAAKELEDYFAIASPKTGDTNPAGAPVRTEAGHGPASGSSAAPTPGQGPAPVPPTAPGDHKDKAKAFDEFLDAAGKYDTAHDSNVFASAKKVEEALDRLEAIAKGTPKEEDLPAVIESFVVASQAFLAAAVAQEKLADDAETRKKLGDALDKFLGRDPKPKR